MNKKYKEAFSNVSPSEKSVERIFEMTQKKKISLKPLLIAAIVIATSAVCLVSANAATDGAVVEQAEKIVNSIKVFINGEEAHEDEVQYTHNTKVKDGKAVECHEFDIVNDGGEKCNISVGVADDGNAIYVSAGGDFNADLEIGVDGGYFVIDALGDGEKEKIKIDLPTTSAAEN